MDLRKLTLEHIFYFVALALALSVRTVNLGAQPLAESEADLALQALQVARGEPANLAPHPAYIAFTSIAFSLFDGSDALARLFPVVMGCVLAMLPFLFRKELGSRAALILAFALALDPGIVAASRQAGTAIPSISLCLLTLGLVTNGYYTLAGIAGGLALLSGPALVPGLIGLALAAGAGVVFRLYDDMPQGIGEMRLWRSALVAALSVVLLVGALFLRSPQGISAWLSALPAYLSGWGVPSNVPALRLLAALLVYQPLALIFALVGILRGWLKAVRITQFVSLWLLASLLLALANPSRQVVDLAWVLIPLWLLAARELAQYLFERVEQPLFALGQAVLVLLLLTLAWLNFTGLSQIGPEAPGYLERLGVILGLVALSIVTIVLLGLGWSWRTARAGLVWGLSAALGIYSLAGMFGSTQPSASSKVELWQTVPGSGDIHSLIDTIDMLSIWKTGEPGILDVTLAIDSPALRWGLRNYPGFNQVPEGERLLVSGSPSVVITRQGVDEPSLAATYRGQDFILRTYPGWVGVLPVNLNYWLTLRQAPLQDAMVILWARGDLFPGGSSLPNSGLPIIPQLEVP